MIEVFAGAGLVLQFIAGWRLRSLVRRTSLTAAWGVWLAAWLGWTGTWIVTLRHGMVSPGVADQLWYTAAVVTIAVPIAVLGARRPGHTVWLFFVLLPLILVLCWPAWIDLPRTIKGTRLSLEEPTLLGVGLVAVMGFGNYLGTRWTIPAALMLVAIGCVIWPISFWGNEMQSHAPNWRAVATGANSIAALAVLVQLRRPEVGSKNRLASKRPAAYNPPEVRQRVDQFDRLWFAFRDLYGVVWARRFQERVNHYAQTEKWPLRLTWYGWMELPPDDPTPSDAGVPDHNVMTAKLDRIEQQQRWLLTRFVQPEWIDRRLV